MENRAISASLSTQSLTFRPGGPPVSFEVTVRNDSNQFAAFQLEVIAAGAGHHSSSHWYQLSPEVSAAKPPGSTTQFRIVILEPPLPGFIGTVNLTTKISSPQLREERKLLVCLTIEPGATPTLVGVNLPIKQFQVYPRNAVDIPVEVQNFSSQPTDVLLRFTGLNPAWLINGTELRLQIDPNHQAETTFQCQPLAANQSPSQDYPFTIEVISRDSPPARTKGNLEVLPVGFVEFKASPQKQTIPKHKSWLPDRKANSTIFHLLFKNASNLHQQVSVQLQGRDCKRCTCAIVPETAHLGLGETLKIALEVGAKRSWFGLAKTLRLEAKALLSNQRLGSPDPATQLLELQVQPIFPLWLLVALPAFLLTLILLLLRSAPLHTDFVKAVLFSGDSFSAVSGSDDCTIRLWNINSNRLQPKGSFENPPNACSNKRPESRGLLGVTGQPVWALQFIPKDNDRVAVGLENGAVQLWNVPRHEQEYELKDPQDPTSDRVFDLVFTSNSLRMFSSHGSGKVRIWTRSSPSVNFKHIPQVQDLGKRQKYPIQALALSHDEKMLATAGGFKRVIVWDYTNPKGRPRQLSAPELNGGENDFINGLAFTSPGFPELLATGDSDGFIGIWDLKPCKTSSNSTQPKESTAQTVVPIQQTSCAIRRDHWQAAERPIRSLVFSLSSPLQLVSAGDDGRIITWRLTDEAKRDPAMLKGQQIYHNPKAISSIALAEDNRGTMIVSGGDDFQVRLHRLN